MRDAKAAQLWVKLERGEFPADALKREVTIGEGTLSLNRRCLVLGGFNGAGKTRTLHAIRDQIGDSAHVLRVSEECQHVLRALRSRNDIADMEQEVQPTDLPQDLLADLGRIVGMDYSAVQWFELELEGTEDQSDADSGFGDEGLLPHFKVTVGDLVYSSTDMGLGELSVHLTLWKLSRLADSAGAVILLDEPDAHLPPKGRPRLLQQIMHMALKSKWQVVITTHSQEIMQQAARQGALGVVQRSAGGSKVLVGPEVSDAIARDHVPFDPIDLLIYVEDESAWALTWQILAECAPTVARRCHIIWGKGDGYLRALAQAVPRPPQARMQFCFVFDGDQRDQPPKANAANWPSFFLPGTTNPDAMLRTLKADPPSLATALGVPLEELEAALDGLQGEDDHDWTDGLCDRIGVRTSVLLALATHWVGQNAAEAQAFADELAAALNDS